MNILVNCRDLISTEIYELEQQVGFHSCWIYHKLKLYLKESRTDKLPRSKLKSVAGILRTDESTLLALLDHLPSTLAAHKGQFWQLHEITKELATLEGRVKGGVKGYLNKGKGKGSLDHSLDPPKPPDIPEPPTDNSPDAPKHLRRKSEPLKQILQNIWLTKADVDRLADKIETKEEIEALIRQLNLYADEEPKKFKRYKDHYLTILKWRDYRHSKGQKFYNHPELGWNYYFLKDIENAERRQAAGY